MRIESSVTSISWIPSEAIIGMTKLPFAFGVAHYDDPPPDEIEDLAVLQANDKFRFANELRAWVDVVDGEIIDYGHAGGGRIGSTTLKLGAHDMTLAATALDDLRPEPVQRPGSVTFTQTAGGQTGAPAPRRVAHPPFMKIQSPTAWTTMELTINADGTSSGKLAGCSPFPRHWIYDHHGKLIEKSGLIEFKSWYRHAFGKHSPWGDEESPAFATAVESALERQLSSQIMRGGVEPKIKKVAKGKPLCSQGDPGRELFLVLDGVIAAEVDGEVMAEFGPGSVLGERALIEEHGRRTATLRAVTKCKVAAAARADIAPDSLAELSQSHHKEDGKSREHRRHMGGDHDFSSGNRLRIAAVIVLASISYWLAVVMAAVAVTLTVIFLIALKAVDAGLELPTSAHAWAGIGIGLLVIVAISAVVGSLIALVRIPTLRRALEDRMLWESGAELVEPDQYPEVRNLLAGLAIAADVPAPRVAVIHDRAPNSFGVGTRPQHTVVGVTTGLMDVLTRDELEAVLAYEVSRIGSWDVALSSWTVALTSSAIEAADDEVDGGFFVTVLGYVPRRMAQWLQVWAMRGQTRERDRIAIAFTRHPQALIRALEKLHADPTEVGRVTRATAPLWLEYPTGIEASTRWAHRLGDELSLDGRIDRIRELAGVQKE